MTDRNRTDFRLAHLREKLGDLYEFEAMLGRGAFAIVYLVRNLRLDRYEALKVLAEAYDDDDAFVKRFNHEVKVVASLDHQSIVKVYDFGEIDGIVWFSMQYVDGPTLRSELRAQGQLSPASVVGLCIPLLDALDYSHSRGTVHRDIKPSNILLDARGNPFLMDFGIAKSTNMALKTMTGRILGTPAYISPEQVQGQVVDGRADIYSLGAAMYEMLAGRPPFDGDDALQIVVQRLHEDPLPISTYCAGIDADLETIIMRALEREVDARFATAGTMRQALIDYWSEEGHPDGFVLRSSAPKLVQIEEQSTTTELDVGRRVDSEQKTKVMAAADATMIDEGRRRSVWWSPVWWALAVIVAALSAVLLPRFLTTTVPPEPAVVSTGVKEVAGDPSSSVDRDAPDRDAPDLDESMAAKNDVDGEPGSEPLASSSTDLSVVKGSKSPTSDASDVPVPETSAPETPAPETPTPQASTSKRPEPAASRPAAPQPVIRRAVVAPKIRHQPAAVLSPELTARCAGQAVIVSLRVDETGAVVSSRVLRSSVEGCGEAAQTVAREYLFDPGKDAEGLPVAASATINIRFDEARE